MGNTLVSNGNLLCEWAVLDDDHDLRTDRDESGQIWTR
jgi:hypothetical protein